MTATGCDAATTTAASHPGHTQRVRMSATPGVIAWTGRPPGANNQSVYGDRLGLSADELADLHSKGVI